MYRFVKLLLLLTPLLFVSCLDIVEEFDLNDNKGGKVTYTFNLSQSKIKINTLLKLDSIKGFKIPKLHEVEQKLAEVVKELNTKKGITSATYSVNHSDFIYTLSISFTSIENLDNAVQSLSYWELSSWKPTNKFYELKNNVFQKNIELIDLTQQQEIEINKNKETLKQGNYTFVLRSKNLLEIKAPSELNLSGNKKAVMLRKSSYDIINNGTLTQIAVVLKP